MPALIDTYRQNRYERKKEPVWAEMSRRELLLTPTRSAAWPVFCHSEVNSRDIQYIKQIGMVDCYYFWHGLITRDWFRHWRHHPDIVHGSQHQYRFLLYARDHSGSREYRKGVLDQLGYLKSQIKHNWGSQETITSDYSAKIVIDDAIDSAVHVVSETLFETEKIHLTEKIFKPMVMMQPFIVFAGPGSLAYLRTYGFRTFDSVWDESYDAEPDHDRRRQKILDLIHSLSQKSQGEFQAIMQRCQTITEHNRRHFFSDQFEKIMLDELHSNLQQALHIQKEKLQEDPGGSYFYLADSLQRRGIVWPSLIDFCIRGMSKEIACLQPMRWQKICQQYHWAAQLI